MNYNMLTDFPRPLCRPHSNKKIGANSLKHQCWHNGLEHPHAFWIGFWKLTWTDFRKKTARPRFKSGQPNSKRKFFWGMFFKFIFKAPDIPMWIVLLFSHLLFLGEDLSALLWDESKGCLRHRFTSSRCARIYRWARLRFKSLRWQRHTVCLWGMRKCLVSLLPYQALLEDL